MLGDGIGEGSYGRVKEGYCVETLRRVAVKIMKHSRLKKIQGGEQNVRREIALLKRLRHKNIVELMDVIVDQEKQKFYVVFEYCATNLSELQSRSLNEGRLPLGQSQRYFKQLIRGLQYLHQNSIIHRDIKPANLLVSIDDVIKISDFGVAEEISRYSPTDLMTSSAGTPIFQPPEAASGQAKYSGFKVDIWACGITLYNMISGQFPFDGETTYALFESIAKCDYNIPIEADSQLADLLYGILERDPDKRLSIDSILNHTWLRTDYPLDSSEVPVIPGFKSINEDTIDKCQKKCFISNQQFAHDTTLVPYLEQMFEDLPQLLRRSSQVDSTITAVKKKINAKPQISDNKFLRRFSRQENRQSKLSNDTSHCKVQ